jgi:adenylate cyclase
MNLPVEQRRLAAIMFTDMVGYSALAQRDDALALELLEKHRRILRSIFPRFHGAEIKTIGDGFLVEFHSALEATQCAIEIQRALAKRNHDVPSEHQIEIRIGIHIGDVVHREDDVYGDGVNIASRIQPLARPGGICVSMDVERQVRNALDARFEKLAPIELKNIQLQMDFFRIVLPWEKQTAAAIAKRERTKIPSMSIFALLALVAVIGAWIWRSHSKTTAVVPSAPASKSVAILPFVNMSPDKENEYLSDGITEDLCTALSQIKELHVPARTSSFVFKGKTEDIRQIGKQLNVGTLLEGSVSKSGNKLRISAQLVNVADGFHLWAANYDREMTDILEIRSDISQRVVEALKVQLGVEETERLARKPTEMTEAYEVYLLGRYELNKFTESGFNSAVQHFKRALEQDPSFALANAGLSDAYSMLGYWNYLPPKEAFPEAKRAAARALELDPKLAEAHSALGFVQYEYEWRFSEAEREFKEAVRLNPGSATARFWFAEFLLELGRFREGEEQLQHARELDPLSVRIPFDAAGGFWFQRQFDQALAELQKALAMDPANSIAYGFYGQVLWKSGRFAEAFAAWDKNVTLEAVFSAEEMAEMRQTYQRLGLSGYLRKQSELMQRYLARGKYQSAQMIANHYAAAGSNAEALQWLERAVEERSAWLPEIKLDPTFDGIRSDRRFIAVLKKIGLEK